MSECCRAVLGLLEYDTLKTVRVKSKRVGLMFRLLQIIILGYVIGYSIVWSKSYQEMDNAVATVTTKIKGTATACNMDVPDLSKCPANETQVLDTADTVIPSQEAGAFFLMTNFIEVHRQWQNPDGWDEDPSASTTGTSRVYPCTSDDDCTPGLMSRNGILTGTCNETRVNATLGLCRIYGWGPVETVDEDDASEKPEFRNRLQGILDFTIFIKNQILFPAFDLVFTNVGYGDPTEEYLRTCTWNQVTDPYCPIFRLGDILDAAQIDDLSSALGEGAVLALRFTYDCNLDINSTSCAPQVSVIRLDNSKISVGYNFRYADFWQDENGIEYRRLRKVFGVRVLVSVSGRAGKFSIVPLLVSLGSGLGLLGIATLIADFVVTKVLKNREFYSNVKYELVDDPEDDDFLISTNSHRDRKLSDISDEEQPLLK